VFNAVQHLTSSSLRFPLKRGAKMLHKAFKFCYALLWSVLICSGTVHAQLPTDEEELKDIEMFLNNGAPPAKGWRYQLNADISSPHLIMNPANARAFDGIAMASLQFGVQTARNLYVGVYGRYTGFLYYKPSFIGDLNVQQRFTQHKYWRRNLCILWTGLRKQHRMAGADRGRISLDALSRQNCKPTTYNLRPMGFQHTG
jgi:hypothetical protein